MKQVFGRSPFLNIPGYSQNAVVRLIVYFLAIFVIYNLIRVVMMMLNYPPDSFITTYTDNLVLAPLPLYKTKFWTVLTYGWFHQSFMALFSNMIWLYCFGSMVQMMIGYRQIMPLFIYSLVGGGILCLISQFIPGRLFEATRFMGPAAGLMGLAAAALTISPSYRLFFTDRFSVPLWVIAGIFTFLMLLGTGLQLPLIMMLAGGGLTGFCYITLQRRGYKPGDWIYNLYGRMEGMVTPNEQVVREKHAKKRSDILSRMYEPKHGVTQKKIDDILDKIHLKGYKSLSEEEKNVLLRASKENSN